MKLKKRIGILVVIAFLIIVGALWKATVITNILHVYYQNIQLLDADKDVKSDSKHKDGRYNLVYYMSADQIIDARSTWIGRICSDKIEKQNPIYKDLREKGEDYLRQHP